MNELEKGKDLAIKLAEFFLTPAEYTKAVKKIYACKTKDELFDLVFPNARQSLEWKEK